MMKTTRTRHCFFYSILCLGTVLLVASGCGTARRGAPVGPPLNITEPEVAQGQQVFMRFCNGCHPGGTAGLGPGINDKPLPGFLIRFQVRRGLGVMPAFSREVISDEQLDALVRYLKELRRQKP